MANRSDIPALSTFERLITAISPTWGLTRSQARWAMRHYEGASKGRRTAKWKTPSTSANAAFAGGALTMLRNRARDLVRNNAYAKAGVRGIAKQIVGYGIIGTVQGGTAGVRRDVQGQFSDWAKNVNTTVGNKMNLYSLQRLIVETVFRDGEVLIRRRWRKIGSKYNRVNPLQLEVLEVDFIDDTKDDWRVPQEAGKISVQGIQFDTSTGDVSGYWLYDNHPGDNRTGVGIKSKLVPADEIIHVFDVERPGQVRGVTALAPIIVTLRDFDEYEDAQLVRQKISACFTAFVKTMGGDTPMAAPQAGQDEAGLGDKMTPGTIEVLPAGMDVAFANPPAVTGYTDYASVTLHKVAAGLGVPFELITGDYSRVNFSSARMAWQTFYGNVDDWLWNMIVPQCLDPIFNWFILGASMSGVRTTEGLSINWTAPKRTMIDPEKETSALIKQVRAGFKSHPEAVREMGYDPDELYDEIKSANKKLDEREIVLDSDPRKTTNSGQDRSVGATNNASDTPKDGAA